MPEPPHSTAPEFANDVVRYEWGKQQRQDEERVALAIADAEWDDLTKFFGQYADAFGLTIDPIATPEIYKLLSTSLATTDPMRKKTKAHYGRQRPFERFGDAMPSHEEESLRGEAQLSIRATRCAAGAPHCSLHRLPPSAPTKSSSADGTTAQAVSSWVPTGRATWMPAARLPA